MMVAAREHVFWADDISHDRHSWVVTRNRSLTDARAIKDVEGIFWVDDDMLVPANAFVRLLEHEKDIVGGLAFERRPPYLPIISVFNKDGELEYVKEYPENQLIPVTATGFACLYTSMKAINAVHALPECKEKGPFGGRRKNVEFNEDYTFHLRAHDAGLQTYVDTGLIVPHRMGETYADQGTYQKHNGIYKATPDMPPDKDPPKPTIVNPTPHGGAGVLQGPWPRTSGNPTWN